LKKSLDGGCLCGAVRYRAIGTPIDAGYCHCRLCQRSSGAPVLAWFTVPTPSFSYVRGEPNVFHSSARGRREFCQVCGTQIAFRPSADPAIVDVTIASLDDPSMIEPEYHIWRGGRIAWFETTDRLPRHDGAGADE